MTDGREPVTVLGQDGVERKGTAEVDRFSPVNRAVKATLFVFGGLLGGTACIVIPIVHLFTTWAFPLLGVFMAVRVMRREIVLRQIQCQCWQCGESIELGGGASNDAGWQECPACHARLSIRAAL